MCIGGRVLLGYFPLQDFALPAKGWVPGLAFCIPQLGDNRLRDPGENQSSYHKWQRKRQDTPRAPVFKPLPPRMTALQSRRPQTTWVGRGTHLFLPGIQDTQRLTVTALCRTPRRALVSGQARIEGAGSRGHDTLLTQTWPLRGPPPPPTTPRPPAGPGRPP